MVEAAENLTTHGVRINFGKHKGERLTRVPVSYLRWVANQDIDISPPGTTVTWGTLAQAELDRRGADIPEIEISNHAIDTASLRVLPIWQKEAREGEGLHHWLVRAAASARTWGIPSTRNEGRYHYLGVTWVFSEGALVPVLMTVMRK